MALASSNEARRSICGRDYEAALCLEQKTTDSELIIVDRRGASHCRPSSIFRLWEIKGWTERERWRRLKRGNGRREREIRENMVGGRERMLTNKKKNEKLDAEQ